MAKKVNPYRRGISKRDIVDELLEWGDSFAIALFVVLLIMIFAFRQVQVSGSSMQTTLYDKDRILISNFLGKIGQGDIVVVNSEGLNKTVVKRVIATEGQTVEIDYEKDTVSVDGKILDESYLGITSKDMVNFSFYDKSYWVEEDGVYRYVVPEGTLFLLGDNRNNSTDSRSSSVGFVPTEQVLGKAVLRIFPFTQITTL
ncbi:MAG: signal peptidase I [Oscillospiraceae bacterium]|nr:signal peptidase I [Oscillospiraceae bacterium]